jgi:hypothetical protein
MPDSVPGIDSSPPSGTQDSDSDIKLRDAAIMIVQGVITTFLYFLLYWGDIFGSRLLLPENCFPSYWTLDRVGKGGGGRGEGREGGGGGGGRAVKDSGGVRWRVIGCWVLAQIVQYFRYLQLHHWKLRV